MERQWRHWIEVTFGGVTWPKAFIAAVTIAIVWGALALGLKLAKRWLGRVFGRISPSLDGMAASILAAVRPGLFPVFALYAGLAGIGLRPEARRALALVAAAAFAFQLLLFANRWIDYLFLRLGGHDGKASANAKSNLVAGTKVLVWLLSLLLLLDNFGINISTFVAGLGIGGIAVALAAQAILGDTFGSFTITLDKPFVPGDYIAFGDDEGSVETVGLKTTRIRGVGGEAIVVPNSELTRARLKNFANIAERRGLIQQAIADDTPLEVVEGLPSRIKAELGSVAGVRLSRVHLVGLAPQAYSFEIEWFSEGPHKVDLLDRQQQLYLKLFRLLETDKIAGPAPERLLLTNSGRAVESAAVH